MVAGESMHTASREKMEPHAPAIRKVKYPLRFVVSYVQPITQHYESRIVQKALLQSK